MKKLIKTLSLLLLFVTVIPAIASCAIMALWNSVAVTACNFAAITFWQAAGFFFLGQMLSGGMILGLFMMGGGIHAIIHHDSGRHWSHHWHNMTDEQRREFIEQRRELFNFHKHGKTCKPHEEE